MNWNIINMKATLILSINSFIFFICCNTLCLGFTPSNNTEEQTIFDSNSVDDETTLNTLKEEVQSSSNSNEEPLELSGNALNEKVSITDNDVTSSGDIFSGNKEFQNEKETSASDKISLREILMKLKNAKNGEISSDLAKPEISTGNVTESSNSSDNSSSTPSSRQALCEQLMTEGPIGDVEIVSASFIQKILLNDPDITTRSAEAKCYLVYFFSPYCDFSVAGAPYVNGLAKALIDIPIYGLDSIEYHSMNARYGVMGTPSLILFHNGVIAGRYNASEYSISNLVAFIRHYTHDDLTYFNVTSSDFKAALPSISLKSPSYTLYLAWIFLISCGSWMFLTSETCAKIKELFLNNWREAEAQHAHED